MKPPAKVMLTGSSGFVGSRIAEELRRRAIPYVAACRKADDSSADPSQIVVGEFDDQTDWDAALEDVDVVIHCAARVHIMNDDSADPDAAFRAINTDATLALAKAATRAAVKRFVYLSSIKVNGENTIGEERFSASDPPNPQDAYARSKAEAEAGLLDMDRSGQIEVVIIRPPLVYGPGVKANFARMMRWVFKGWPLPFGLCSNRRAMVFLDNLVDLILCVIAHPKAAGKIFLVSDGSDMTVAQLLEKLGTAFGRPARLFSVPIPLLATVCMLLGRSAEIERLTQNLRINLDETTNSLAWSPPIDVADGLKLTARSFRERSL